MKTKKKGRFRLEAAFFVELSLLFNCLFSGRIFTTKIIKINILIRKSAPLPLIPKGAVGLAAGLFPAHRNGG